MGQANQQWNIPCQLVKQQASVIHQFVQRRLEAKSEDHLCFDGDFLMTTISQPRRRSLLATN